MLAPAGVLGSLRKQSETQSCGKRLVGGIILASRFACGRTAVMPPRAQDLPSGSRRTICHVPSGRHLSCPSMPRSWHSTCNSSRPEAGAAPWLAPSALGEAALATACQLCLSAISTFNPPPRSTSCSLLAQSTPITLRTPFRLQRALAMLPLWQVEDRDRDSWPQIQLA